MATRSDVRRIALSLPETTEASDDFAFSVRNGKKERGFAWVWKERVDSKKARIPNLRLAFFTWHNRVEGQHAGHVMEELEEAYFASNFDRGKFFQGGREILDGVATFLTMKSRHFALSPLAASAEAFLSAGGSG